MATKKYVSLEKLSLYDEKIKKVIADGDAASLASAKQYFDENANLFETAGSVATAKQELQGKIDAVQGNVDIAQAAADKAQGEVDALETLVGTLPEGTTATSVVDYVNVKTAGIATDAALGELSNQVSGLQTTVQGIAGDYLKGADKTELSDAIAAEKARAEGIESGLEARLGAVEADYLTSEDAESLQASIDGVVEDVAAIAEDYLTSAAKTELEGKINVKADQTALDAEVQRATGIEAGLRTDVDAIKGDYLKGSDKTELQGNIDTVAGAVERLTNGVSSEEIDGVNDLINYVKEHGPEVTGMQEDIADNAEAIEGVAGRMDTAEGKITDLEGAVATKVEQSAYDAKVAELAGADTALSGRLDTLEAINHEAYVDADTALKNELNGEIAKKADVSVVEAMDAAYKAADAGIIERLGAVEAQLGDGDGSVADLIAEAKQEAIDAAASAADAKDAEILAAAKKYADDEDALIEARVATLEAGSATHALKSEVEAIAGRVTTVEGKVSTLETEMDAVEAKAAANETAIGTLDTTVAGKASQADLEGAVARIAANETAIASFVEVSEEEINNLFA